MNELHKRIFVAGHRGMVGSAIVRFDDATAAVLSKDKKLA